MILCLIPNTQDIVFKNLRYICLSDDGFGWGGSVDDDFIYIIAAAEFSIFK